MSNYQANFSSFKEDLAGMLKAKLGIDLGSSRLYQKPYPLEFDFVSYPAGRCIPEFIKFNVDDSRTTWEHVSQYILKLGEAGLNDALCLLFFVINWDRFLLVFLACSRFYFELESIRA